VRFAGKKKIWAAMAQESGMASEFVRKPFFFFGVKGLAQQLKIKLKIYSIMNMM